MQEETIDEAITNAIGCADNGDEKESVAYSMIAISMALNGLLGMVENLVLVLDAK